MSAVKRAFASVFARVKASGENRRSLSRGMLASCAVVGGWLLLNAALYGSLIMPVGESEGLLANRSSNGASTSERMTSLPNTPFFGVAPERIKQSQQQLAIDLANIPLTKLKLVLSGVFDSSVGDRASVLVAEKGKSAQRYYAGQSLPGGAEVYTVAVDHIVLRNDGKMEKLTYPEADGRPKISKNHRNMLSSTVSSGVYNTKDSQEQRESIRERLEALREMAKSRQAERQQKP